MIRTYAAFLQNTIKPMLEQLADVIRMANESGLPITEDSLSRVVSRIAAIHFVSIIINGLVSIAIAALICLTCLKLLAP